MRFIKTANEFITIDLDKKTVSQINKNDHTALSIVHIFVFNPDNVETESLKVFAENAKTRGYQIIVHCFGTQERRVLRKKLKGAEKGRHFHFNLMSRDYMDFNLDDRRITIRRNRVDVWNDYRHEHQIYLYEV